MGKPDACRIGHERRKRKNLAWGVCWLILGFIAVGAMECVWDARVAQTEDTVRAYEATSKESGNALVETNGNAMWDSESVMAFVLGEGNMSGDDGLPAGFVEECFDPGDLGDAHCFQKERVVGLLSEDTADGLFASCSKRLVAHAWTKVDAGVENCASFLKEEGEYRWMFVQTFDTGGSSLAVMSFKGE